MPEAKPEQGAVKPTVLFFARGYQADLFPELGSDLYNSVLVTLTPGESARVRRRGQSVAACFEDEFPGLAPSPVPDGYLLTSPMADRFLGRFDHQRRIEILGKEITFWTELLDRHQPVAVVNELVAIEISEVLLVECRRRGIRYLAAMNCVVEDLFYWLPDPMTISGGRLPAVPAVFDLADRADAVRSYMADVAARDYKPSYVRDLSGRRAVKPLLAAVAKSALWWFRSFRQRHGGRFTYEMYDDEYGKKLDIFVKGLFRRYDRIEDLPSDAETVFFPLHQEPEATLNYMSTFYSNQVATIENILKCLTPQQVLVVKEHPVDKGALLQKKFWDVRKRCSNLYFLPAEVHGREVLRRAERVVTLTSTVGWEAALIGCKVYLLGEIFYDRLEGIEPIRDFKQLREALHAPAASQKRVDPVVAEAFVARMAAMSYPGSPFPCPHLLDRANLDRIVAAIIDAAKIAPTRPTTTLGPVGHDPGAPEQAASPCLVGDPDLQ